MQIMVKMAATIVAIIPQGEFGFDLSGCFDETSSVFPFAVSRGGGFDLPGGVGCGDTGSVDAGFVAGFVAETAAGGDDTASRFCWAVFFARGWVDFGDEEGAGCTGCEPGCDDGFSSLVAGGGADVGRGRNDRLCGSRRLSSMGGGGVSMEMAKEVGSEEAARKTEAQQERKNHAERKPDHSDQASVTPFDGG